MSDLNQDSDEAAVKARHFNSGQIDRAIGDAQILVAYAARAGIKIDEKIFNTLISSKSNWDEDEWSNECALEFWDAFRQMNEMIKPATVDSVRAIYREPSKPGWRGFVHNQYGRSEASRAITRYTLWTLFILAIVLFFQIYWVIGNSLSDKLTELLDNEDGLAAAIHKTNLDHDEIEVLFKLKEEEIRSSEEVSTYGFYGSPDWERETLLLVAEREQLTDDLEALKIQLERNFGILRVWAFAWGESVDTGIQNDAIVDKIAGLEEQKENEQDRREELLTSDVLQVEIDANQENLVRLDNELLALESQLNALVVEDEGQETAQEVTEEGESALSQDAVQQAIREKITQTQSQRTELMNWMEQNLLETIVAEIDNKLAVLELEIENEKNQHTRWQAKEEVRRLRLSAEFMLIILQVYLLPILYGLLGASVYVLRKIMREIADATYSPDRSYLLRLALGTLSGLIIGWFVFLLPGQSVVSTLSPMALAFLVGYNIEVVFLLMDRLIDGFIKGDKGDKKSPEDGQPKNGKSQAESQTAPVENAQQL